MSVSVSMSASASVSVSVIGGDAASSVGDTILPTTPGRSSTHIL